MIRPLEAMSKTGERFSVKPYITNRDVRVLFREEYSSGDMVGVKMSVAVTRIDSNEQPPQNIRAITTGHIERTKTGNGYQVWFENEIEFFQPSSSTQPVARAHATATMKCEEGITPSPAYAAFVWDRYTIKIGQAQHAPILGTMLRERAHDISIERLVESHW